MRHLILIVVLKKIKTIRLRSINSKFNTFSKKRYLKKKHCHMLGLIRYSQTSVHESLGSRTIRFTNKFSEHKASRMTYCVSSYEHASRQHREAINWEYQRRQYS
jgi:hypothetical protein